MGFGLFNLQILRLNRLNKKDPKVLIQRFLGAAVPLIVLALVAFAPVLFSGYIWLDEQLVADSRVVRDPMGILECWYTFPGGEYAPVSLALLWLQHHIWGVGAGGYHLANIVLHGLSAVLLWRILSKLRVPGAWTAAALFAVYPAFLSSVGWVSQFGTVLATVFCLASIAAFLKYDVFEPHTRDPVAYRWALCFFVLALLSKTAVALPLPVTLLALMWWRRGSRVGIRWKHAWRCTPFFLCLIPALWAMAFAHTRGEWRLTGESVSWSGQAAEAAWMTWYGIGKTLVPVGQHIIYPLRMQGVPFPLNLLPVGVAVIALIGLWLYRGITVVRAFFFALLCYLVAMAPVFLLPRYDLLRYAVTADYWKYPMAFLFVIPIVAGGTQLLAKAGNVGKRLAPLAAILLVAAAACHTYALATAYQDSVGLWEKTITMCPDNWIGYQNLGKTLFTQGRYADALEPLTKTIELNPNDVQVHELLGTALRELGDLEASKAHLAEAQRFGPNIDDHGTGGPDKADAGPQGLSSFLNVDIMPAQRQRDILHYDERLFTAYDGPALDDLQASRRAATETDLATAKRLIESALRADPDALQVRYLAGYIRFLDNDMSTALTLLNGVLTEQPRLIGANYMIGEISRQRGEFDRAMGYYNVAVHEAGSMGEAFLGIATVYITNNDAARAVKFYEAALASKSDYVAAMGAFARVLSVHPNPKFRNGQQALKLAERACILSAHQDAWLLDTLAAAYAEAGHYSDAVETANDAIDRAEANSQPQLKKRIQTRLALYQAGRPHHAKDVLN